MKKMVMLLGIIAFCVPVYGDILVYRVSGYVRGVWELDGFFGTGVARFNAYMVVDYNTAEEAVEDSSIIFYGRSDTGEKAQETIDDVIVDFGVEETGSYGVWADININGIDGVVTGRARARPIGSTEHKTVPSILRGHTLINEDGIPLTKVTGYGSGPITAYLNINWTRAYNKAGDSFDDVVCDIEEHLENRGYAP